MGVQFSGQRDVSKKTRPSRDQVPASTLRRARRMAARQEGTLWQRKMRTLALRLPKGRTRRSRSGAPMKRR